MKRCQKILAILLSLVLLASAFGCTRESGPINAPLALAVYPQMAPYASSFDREAFEAWSKDVEAQQRDLGDTSAVEDFFAQSAQVFLKGTAGENRTYSPLNIYMALAMLAQVTGGESREQILSTLGSESIDALRQQASDVWNANYRDDGSLTSILASSLWLDREIRYNQDTMDTLAKDFYASSYRGEMGSDEYNQLFQDWLNEQTGGLLEEAAGDMELDRETVMALATTVSFQAKWYDEFMESETAPQTFHGPDRDVETDFMHQSEERGDYYWGERFSAISQPFAEGGDMWFLLPDEGVSPEELLADDEAMEFLFCAHKYEWEKQDMVTVNKSIPKFDISSQFDLKEGMKALGITDVFDPMLSDFTPMTTDVKEPIILSEANHAARVTIDEEGCTATAFTVMKFEKMSACAGAPDEVDFVLDRPFFFCITGESGLPLFMGIVNNPNE